MRFFVLTAIVLMVSLSFADGASDLVMPKQMEGAEIFDKLGAKLNPALTFTDHNGTRVAMSAYFGSEQELPAIVTIGYYECPMLCSLVLKGLLDSLTKMSLKLGKDYRILSFSIDPKENSELAALKRKSHLKALSQDDGPWEFFTGDEKSIAELSQTLGFGYKFDEASGEYAHGAGIFILTPNGVLSRTLWGLVYEPMSTKLALVEASNGKVGSVVDRILLSCFHYVPDKHKYGFYVFGAMRAGGALTVLFLGSMLGWYWFSERRRRTRVS